MMHICFSRKPEIGDVIEVSPISVKAFLKFKGLRFVIKSLLKSSPSSKILYACEVIRPFGVSDEEAEKLAELKTAALHDCNGRVPSGWGYWFSENVINIVERAR